MKKEKSRIIYYMFLLIPFFEPISLYYLSNGIISDIFSLWRIISSIIIILKYNRKTIKVKLSFLLFFSCYLLVSIININSLYNSVMEIMRWYALILLSVHAIKEDFNNYIKAIYIFLMIMILINFLGMLKYPQGIIVNRIGEYNDPRGWTATLYDYVHFLERDNRLINWILPLWMSTLLLFSKKIISTKKYIFTMVIIVITLIKTWSATSLIGAFIMMIPTIAISFDWKKILKLITEKTVFIILVVANIYIIFMNAKIGNFFANIIQNLLKKDITFTGRTVIWERAIQMIQESPLFGYGTAERGYIINNIYAHNVILDILIEGGVLLFITFLCMFFYKNKKTIIMDLDNKVLLTVLFAWGIMGLTESFLYQYSFWLVFGIWSGLKIKESRMEVNIE